MAGLPRPRRFEPGAGSMRRGLFAALAFVFLISSNSDAATQTLSCHGAQKPRQVAELLFGRAIGGRVGVSAAAWARFVAREMTPRFPDGLTVTDSVGQWRDRTHGALVREPSKRVEILLPGNADDDDRLAAVVAAYKRQFRQHSVGVIVQAACVAF
jgi:uncharacterized protein DUF3574